MIIWGYKGYKKELGHTQSAIQCGNCQQTAPWDIIETVENFPSTGFLSSLMVENIMYSALSANMAKRLKNKILMNI